MNAGRGAGTTDDEVLSAGEQEPLTAAQGAHLVSRSSYDLLDRDAPAQRLPALKADPHKPNPKLGTGLVEVRTH